MVQSDPISFLIVDDDAADRAILGRAIRRHYADAAITEATGIADVRALSRSTPFDVVFVDLRMPQVDGLAALREMQHEWPYSAFIMITGHGDERIAAEAIKVGAMDYLPKEHLAEEPIDRLVQGALERTRLRRRLDDQLRELKGFATALIHDIRAPVRHIRFLCGEVMDGIARHDRTIATDSLRGIDSACERMSDLLASLVEHIQADEVCEMVPVDLDALVGDVVEALSEEIAYAGARVRHLRLPTVSGDAGKLERLFGNLIRNAIRYRGERPPEIDITAAGTDGAMEHILVTDNGVGIEPEYLSIIFEPFRRLHSEHRVPGRGLGLATCAKIVAHHGGRIWCESVPGKGSVFHVTLKQEAEDAAPESGGDLARLTKLLGEG